MKRQWSADKNEIVEELNALAENEILLILARSGEDSSAITVRHILAEAGSVLVEVGKPPELVLDETEQYYVFYQRDRQALMRGFSLHLISFHFDRADADHQLLAKYLEHRSLELDLS